MTNKTFVDHDGACWARVNKRRAETLYNAGHTITITPVNMTLNHVWCTYIRIGHKLRFNSGEPFDLLVNAFAYYNCNNEAGRYPAYYVRSEVLE